MSDFPLLKTGAVTQYPSSRGLSTATRVMEFLDGSEQRFRQAKGPLRQWVIRLDLLLESELKALENFFRAQAGRREEFTFVDPWSAEAVPHCSLADDVFEFALTGHDQGRTTLNIRENRH
jgi:hypothetical protein